MQSRLITYFSKITALTKAEEAALVESMDIEYFQKGEYIVKEGANNQQSFFVLDGLVRQFKNRDGDDITTAFYTEEQWIISLADMTGDILSPHSLICMENTAVVTGDEEKAIALFKQFPKFETISRQIMESALLEQQKLMSTYITDKPEQRYLRLMESRPDVLQRVPQYDIATYIGVKPESLSRIRKKLHQKG